MPRNTFKCPECGGNYKYCKFQRALTKTQNAKGRKGVKVYVCKGTHDRHPHPPLMLEVLPIYVPENDPEKAKKVLHSLDMSVIYIDTLFDYMAEWRQYMKRKYGNAVPA